MPLRSEDLCKPCLNGKYSLRTQLLLSFLSLTVVSLVLALTVVVGSTVVVGDKAEDRAKRSLEEQIKRHLKAASTEAAATIGEKLRRLKDGVLDSTAFALRDTLQENIILAGGSQGYPLRPIHTDLRDTEIAEATLDDFHRQNIPVNRSRSVWYYANDTSFTATVPAEGVSAIEQTAKLDLLWPTMYNNSKNTKAVYVSVPLSPSTPPAFRYFPGAHLSAVPDSFYACEEGDAKNTCFDPSDRPWYTPSVDDATGISTETKLGDVIVTDPYIGATGLVANWLVTIARAVYGDTDSTSNQLLGVVGVDVLLEAVQELVEEISFLQSGYSILATAADGTILAAPVRVWDRNEARDNPPTVCAAANGMCPDGHQWKELLSGEVVEFQSTSFSDDGGQKAGILIAAPVTFTVDSGDADITHYIISAVPREEIFSEADRMHTLIRESAKDIWLVTVSVAAATLIAALAAVCAISGRVTRAIGRMASAARSIAEDGAKTNVFGSVIANWSSVRNGVPTGGVLEVDGSISSRTQRMVDYLLCRGEDEISALAHEFSMMITGLGKRGSAARATGLEDSPGFIKNPFTVEFARASHTAPSMPSAPNVE